MIIHHKKQKYKEYFDLHIPRKYIDTLYFLIGMTLNRFRRWRVYASFEGLGISIYLSGVNLGLYRWKR